MARLLPWWEGASVSLRGFLPHFGPAGNGAATRQGRSPFPRAARTSGGLAEPNATDVGKNAAPGGNRTAGRTY